MQITLISIVDRIFWQWLICVTRLIITRLFHLFDCAIILFYFIINSWPNKWNKTTTIKQIEFCIKFIRYQYENIFLNINKYNLSKVDKWIVVIAFRKNSFYIIYVYDRFERIFDGSLTSAHRKWDFFRSNPPGFSINFCSRPFFEIIRKLKSIEAFMSNVNAIWPKINSCH